MAHFATTRHGRLAILASLLLGMLVFGGCGGGSSGPSTPAQSLSVATKTLPAGQVGNAYAVTLAASGGTAPYTWSLASGALPSGLSLSSTGAISGTPTAGVSAGALTVEVTDAENPAQSATATLALTIASATLVITTTSLPSGQVGAGYSANLAATGGTAPYTWSLTSGTLPGGLSLNAASGVLAGFPSATAAGVPVTFAVTDSGKPVQTRSVTLPLTIAQPPLGIQTSSLPKGQVGTPYTTQIAATGGEIPYHWVLSGGTLPAGLTLNAATGAISGTPSGPASVGSLTFQVTDASNPQQSDSVMLPLTIAPPPVNITTTSLPYGQLTVAYSATFAATGGTAPYTWTLSSGTLPAGLTLSPSGSITGTPTALAALAPLTFQATDSSTPVQTSVVVLTLPVSPAGITVTFPPQVSTGAAALTITQTIGVSATTNDMAGVAWSLTPASGSISPQTSQSGNSVTVTAPATAGVYTLTATSLTQSSVSASITVGVTDLGGVFTWHNDLARDGLNAHEYALTPANVNTASFGKLFSCTVDGAVYAQPLWVANATVGGSQHNVVLVATQHDSLYAFDADAPSCVTLWHARLLDSGHGGSSGEVPVTSGPNCRPNCLVGQGLGDIQPEVGVTSTPVIDPASGTLYVVSKSMNATGTLFYQRLHAIDYTTGNEMPGSPVTIGATYPGMADGGTVVTFSPQTQNQRAGLALVNGTVYIASGSHEDTSPYYGWVIAYTYNGSQFTPSGAYCTTPNVIHGNGGKGGSGGIWMAGAAPAADSSGNLYVITANGEFDVTSATPPNNDYGDSFLQLANGPAGLGVSSYFTPSDEANDLATDNDAGSGGAAVLANLQSGLSVMIGGGKDGTVYVLNANPNTSAMGGFGDANALESFSLNGPKLFSTGAFWNNTYYLAAAGDNLKAFPFNPASTTQPLSPTPVAAHSPQVFGQFGVTPSVSATGASANGIIWVLDAVAYCTNGASACGPAVLRAYGAGNLGNELWDSSMVSGDAAGFAVKFTVPTVANGKVYVGTRGNNTGGAFGTTTASGELDVFGLVAK